MRVLEVWHFVSTSAFQEGLTHGEEEVTDIMGDVDGDTHVSKMEPITQPNQCESDDVVKDQLLEIFPGLFEHENKNDTLLGPIACLKKVVGLEECIVFFMWKAFEHSGSIEIPERTPRHDIQTKGAKNSEVHGGVDLFHESGLFRSILDTALNGYRPNESLHEELAGEAEDDGVEGHECDVLLAFAVHDWSSRIVWSQWVR